MRKIVKNIIFIILFMAIILIAFQTVSNAGLYLNNLDIDAQIDTSGNMRVTETWNIKISNTNTLYKTFTVDKSKYSEIVDVDVQDNNGYSLKKANKWEYHLEKGYYYGGLNNNEEFEICWGVGLDNGSATRTYKISYTVVDAITVYNDCAELYWQFIGDKFEINADKINGTIKLPSNAGTKEDIKVWGHVKTLNGEIYATSTDTVKFWLDNYKGKNYVEVRMAFPNNMIMNAKRVHSTSELEKIIDEETVWANEANAIREREAKVNKIAEVLAALILVFGGVFVISRTVKYIRILKNTKKIKPTQELEYFREKPNKESTPGEAKFIYDNGASTSYTAFGNVFSATLLNLKLKKYFDIVVNKNERGKEEITISKTSKPIDDLEYEEKEIAKFVYMALDKKDSITIKNLQKYIKNHSTKVSNLIENTSSAIMKKNINEKNYDENTAKKKTKYASISVIYFIIGFMTFVVFPISVPFVVNGILLILINKKLSRLTQKGVDEKEQWKGLKRYMEDFSLLNEKEVPAIEIWEEYLVYATVFGIADKVIKQLKLVYPNFDEMSNLNTSSYIYIMSHTNFNSSFSSAISSSISSTMSSGSGSGGGFSGGGGFGGGGRRRRRPLNKGWTFVREQKNAN